MKIYEYIIRIKDQASDRVRKVGSSFNSGTRDADKFSKAATQSGNSMNFMASAAKYATTALLVVATAVGAFAYKASRMSAEMEQTKISFEVMLGSAKQARDMLSSITDLAIQTPFGRKELQDNARLLLSFGVEGKKILPTLNTLSNIAQGNKDKLYHLTLAFAQMSSAGRLMGQDLLQMVNAGFNPLQIISKKTGLSMATLKKRMEDGAISAKMVEAAFRSATEAGGLFYGMNERQAATFEGRLSKLSENIEIFSTGVGDSINKILSPALDYAIKKLDMMIDKTGSLTNENNKSRDSFKNLRNNVAPLLDQYQNLYAKHGNRTHAEKEKMFDLMQQIGTQMPYAVTRMDTQGRVTNIDAARAKKFIRLKEDEFLANNSTAQDAIMERLAVLNKERAGNEFLRDKMQAGEMSKGSDSEKNASWIMGNIKRISEESAKLEGQLAQLRNDQTGAYLKDPAKKADDNSVFDPLLEGGKGEKDKKDKGLDRINGGGRQAVNVTIHLNNLIGEQNFDVKNLKESMTDMERAVTEALLKVLNSANYAASQ